MKARQAFGASLRALGAAAMIVATAASLAIAGDAKPERDGDALALFPSSFLVNGGEGNNNCEETCLPVPGLPVSGSKAVKVSDKSCITPHHDTVRLDQGVAGNGLMRLDTSITRTPGARCAAMGGFSRISVQDLVFSGPANCVLVATDVYLSIPVLPSFGNWSTSGILGSYGLFNAAGEGPIPNLHVVSQSAPVSLQDGVSAPTPFQIDFGTRIVGGGSESSVDGRADLRLSGLQCDQEVFRFYRCDNGQPTDEFTANSEDARIVDNRFVSGCTFDLNITILLPQDYLDHIFDLSGSVIMVNVNGVDVLVIPNLGNVDENITATGNNQLTTVDLAGLQSVGGSVTLSGNPALTSLDLSLLLQVLGSFVISGNPALGSIAAPGMTSVGGDVNVTDNDGTEIVDLSSLATVGGDINVTDNDGTEIVDLSSLATVGGDVNVTDTDGTEIVDLSSLATVGGSLTVDTTGTGTFDVTGADVTGDTDLETHGYTAVAGTTAHGSTDVAMTNADAVMHVQIPGAAFVAPVDFSITRIDPATLPPVNGMAADGSDAIVDPLDAYVFNFAVPTLNQDASLTFEVYVDALDAATRASLLEALASWTATLATHGDAPGSAYQAFPVCAGGQVPMVDGCVLVENLDADGQPTTGTPAVVRFSNVVGHFSTWSVAIVTPHACVAVSDGNPCTTDTCDPETGQLHAPVAPGTSCSDGNVCNGAETCNAAGTCVAGTPMPAPLAVGTLSFVSATRLVWSPTPDATQWNTYAGTIPAVGGLSSHLPGSPYDLTCFENGDALGDGATAATDTRTPLPGRGFFYLVSGRSACAESALGFSSSGITIPNAAPCQ